MTGRRLAGLGLLGALALAGAATLHALTPPAPGFEAVRAVWRPSEAWLLDRHGEPLHARRVDPTGRRTAWVRLEEVSPALREAVLRAEDRRFHRHGGVDALALAGALRDRLLEGRRRGASTLSMQVAGLIDPALRPGPGGRSASQKLRQMLAARALEAAWGKSRVLEAYLNLAPSRGELRGVGALALGLFGKTPAGLGREESAVLAALLAAPSARPERVAARACALLGGRALAAGQAEPACAGLTQRVAAALASPHRRWSAPAAAPHLAQRLLRHPGERLRTTLEAGVQRMALAALRARLTDLEGRNVRDAAALVVDNRSGEVLAWVGSAGAHSRAGAVDGVLARRQAGSTLKPFLYALALERRLLTAASLLEDAPVSLHTAAGLYAPQNYERGFRGLVSVRSALAGSLNVPAVRTLELTGVAPFHALLQGLGYAGLEADPEHYGWSLALGSADVSLLEQVGAYRALATGGAAAPLKLLPGRPPLPRGDGPLAPATAWLVSDILADAAGRSPTFGLDSPLSTRFWTAVKTGTSKDMRDNWCIGYSDRYTVGVWVGNFEGDAMRGVSGVSGAAPAWLDIMTALHAGRPSAALPPPEGLRSAPVRFEAGAEPARQEWFLAGTHTERVRAARGPGAAPVILSPPEGLVIALDPDIPADLQAVPLRASGGRADLRWRLNGALLEGGGSLRWTPRPGRWLLELEDAGGRRHGAVRFEVRGRRG